MPLPWQPVTSRVKLRFWSVLHIFAEWEHPISVPLSSVLIFDHTSLELKASELLAATSAVTHERLWSGDIWFLWMVMQLFPAPQKLLLVHQSSSHSTEQKQVRFVPAHPEKVQLKLSSHWAETPREKLDCQILADHTTMHTHLAIHELVWEAIIYSNTYNI